MAVIIDHRLPTVEEYNALRLAVGWPTFEEHLVQRGLANTLYGVIAIQEGGKVIAMGRIVGDDAIYMHIQDVIKQSAGKNTNVGLMCSKGREDFYRSFGFVDRPNEKYGSGMIKVIE